MDSGIEELALIIRSRATLAADTTRSAADGFRGDRYQSWRRMAALAGEILSVIETYRKDHKEEYEDTETIRLRAERKELHQQIVSLRGELRGYKEREKTMGWSQE